MSEKRNVITLLRWFAPIAAACLLGCGTASTSLPVAPPTTPPVPPAPTLKPRFAYTANQGGSISGYLVDPSTGALTPIDGFPVAVGGSPYLIIHDPQNRFLIVDDNGASMLHVYAINPATGKLSEIASSPYSTLIQPGDMAIDPSGTHLYLYRTGANAGFPGVSGNQIFSYNLSSTGVLTAVTGTPLPTGSPTARFLPSEGMVVNIAGTFLYLQNLFNIYVFNIDAVTGSLSLLQTLSLPSQLGEGIALDPNGKYLYAADLYSLRSYAIDPLSGLLSLTRSTAQAEPGGAYTISLSPNGQFAYTIENNNDLVSYAVTDGAFTPVGMIYPGIYGLRIAVDPSDSFVYVPQSCSNCPSGLYNVIHQFSITKIGGLVPLTAPTVPAGVTPYGITVVSQ